MTGYEYTAIWSVDPSVHFFALIEEAEPELHAMVDAAGVMLTDTPRWVLTGDRLVARATARRRAPWDEPDTEDAALAYLIDLLPDPGGDSQATETRPPTYVPNLAILP